MHCSIPQKIVKKNRYIKNLLYVVVGQGMYEKSSPHEQGNGVC